MSTTRNDRHGDGRAGRRPTPMSDAWRSAYRAKLLEAIELLTDAARLARPQLLLTDDVTG